MSADAHLAAPPSVFDLLSERGWIEERLPGLTGSGVRVGVIDSGWDRGISHPRIRTGAGLLAPDDELAPGLTHDDADRIGHGTACAELLLRVAPGAEVVPVRVFGSRLETSPWVLAGAIRWAADQGLHLVSLSLGTRRIDGMVPLYAACEHARRCGTLVVAANFAGPGGSCPAVFQNVIGVGMLRGSEGFRLEYRADEGVETFAPGEHDLLWLAGERRRERGTSFAAPVVAGIATLLLERHSGATLEEMREMLAGLAAGG